MARPIIRPPQLYYGGKKVAEITEGDYELASGDQMEVAAEGYLGHTDGATTSKVNATMIAPVKGLSIPVLVDMINKKYVSIRLPEDGKIHDLDMRCLSIRYSWNHKAGENRCVASFEGGEPELTG